MTSALTKVTPAKKTKLLALRKWVLRIALVLLILAPLMFIVAALGYKMGIFSLGLSLSTLTFKVGPLLLLASLGAGVISLALAFLVKPRKGLTISILAVLVPVIGLAHAGSVKKTAAKLPFIHDITTDTQNPPQFTDAILSERAENPKSNSVVYTGKKDKRSGKLVSVMQVKGYPDVRTLILEDEADVVFSQAQAAVQSLGWALKSENVDTGIIEATDTTFWYGFKDDVVIRIKPSEGGGSVLDIRSISRVGGSDLGTNAKRIRAFTKKIQG
ncbi:MAG: DUF1499 domain-containing protein [Alphaproteobacteria bacterium]